jgi:hypothetical protein
MSTAAPAVALAECIPAPDLARAARLALDALIAILEDAKASVTNRRLAAAAILRLAMPAPQRAPTLEPAPTPKQPPTVSEGVAPRRTPEPTAPAPASLTPSPRAAPILNVLARSGAPTPRAPVHTSTVPASCSLHTRASPSRARASPPTVAEPSKPTPR